HIMSTLSDINNFFDLDEEIQEINMDLDDDNIDYILNSILDMTDRVGHI
ncbi:21918_t:CDS:1, partial [Cetraspora pellucida]